MLGDAGTKRLQRRGLEPRIAEKAQVLCKLHGLGEASECLRHAESPRARPTWARLLRGGEKGKRGRQAIQLALAIRKDYRKKLSEPVAYRAIHL